MSHLHVVDGVLPWWVVGATLVLAALVVLGVLRSVREEEKVRFLARVGVTGAALLVIMSLPLGPGIHLSLAPLAGILLGPGGGFLAALLASASLAPLGHGGLTAVGANGLFMGGQAAAGALLFRALRGPLGTRGGAVAASGAILAGAAVLAVLALRALPVEPSPVHPGHGEEQHHGPAAWGLWVVAGFAAAAVVVETALTASVVGFLARVRTDLVTGGAPRPRVGKEPA